MASRKESGSSSRSSIDEKQPASAKADDRVRIGTVARSHGSEGAFVVGEPTERISLFDPGSVVHIGGRELTVQWRKGTAERPIVKLTGADGRELRGAAITVPRSALGSLGAGEYLADDLIGAEVFDGASRLGHVADVLLLPAADVLEVERAGADPLLVPLVEDAVRSIDVQAGRIDVDSRFLDAD